MISDMSMTAFNLNFTNMFDKPGGKNEGWKVLSSLGSSVLRVVYLAVGIVDYSWWVAFAFISFCIDIRASAGCRGLSAGDLD